MTRRYCVAKRVSRVMLPMIENVVLDVRSTKLHSVRFLNVRDGTFITFGSHDWSGDEGRERGFCC